MPYYPPASSGGVSLGTVAPANLTSKTATVGAAADASPTDHGHAAQVAVTDAVASDWLNQIKLTGDNAYRLISGLGTASEGVKPRRYQSSNGSNQTPSTSQSITFPATVRAGDLIVIFMAVTGLGTVTPPAGFTSLGATTSVRLAMCWKSAAGTEGGTTVQYVTGASTSSAWRVIVWDEWSGTAPEVSTETTGTSTAPNSASLTPSWGAMATDWWSVIAYLDSVVPTVYPTDYAFNGANSTTAPVELVTTQRRRPTYAATEDPGAFTITNSVAWSAYTLAIRPYAPANPQIVFGAGNSAFEGGAAGDVRLVRTGKGQLQLDGGFGAAIGGTLVLKAGTTGSPSLILDANESPTAATTLLMQAGSSSGGSTIAMNRANEQIRVQLVDLGWLGFGGGTTGIDTRISRSGTSTLIVDPYSTSNDILLGVRAPAGKVATLALTNNWTSTELAGLEASGSGTLKLGAGGASALDIWMRRSAAKTLIFDTDGASGALTTVDFKTTNFYVNGAPITAAATQVSRDSGAAGDYLARIKLTADTQYRLNIGLDGSSVPNILMGPGSTTAPDIALERTATSTLQIDANGAASSTNLHLAGIAGQATFIRLFDNGVATNPKLLLSGGGATNGSIQFGPGTTAMDTRLYRGGNAGVLWMDANATAATDVKLELLPAVASAGSTIRLWNLASPTAAAISLETGTSTTPAILLGAGSAAADVRLQRTAAGYVTLDANGASNDAVLRIMSAGVYNPMLQLLVSGDTNPRWQMQRDRIVMGPGNAALDVGFQRTASKVVTVDDGTSGAAVLAVIGQIGIPSNSSALTATEGYSAWNAVVKNFRIWDTQREREIGAVGWATGAFPFGFHQAGTYTTSLALAINGGSVAVPMVVSAHMRIVSISYYNGTGAGTTEAKLYRQYLNNGNAGENTLAEVTGAGFASRSNTASALQTVAVTTAGTYLAPGVYWLVLRNTSASIVFALGSLAGGTFNNMGMAQTKTLGSALGSTLDFVAATWTKLTSVVGVRLNGEVFGQTTAF